ncbi:MAG: hypothetical protein ACLP8S_20280 [Solirubrobacteraceae bacterium]
MAVSDPSVTVEQLLIQAGIDVVSVEERRFPGELFVVVAVAPDDVQRASEEVYRLEIPATETGESVLISVRAAAIDELGETSRAAVTGVTDPRVDAMIQLITSYSRTSLSTPSLQYIQEGQAHLSQLISARHCFVFGRRGAGKTALLVEGRRHVDEQGAVSVWLNAQLYRGYSVGALIVAFAKLVIEALVEDTTAIRRGPSSQEGLLHRLEETATRLRALDEGSTGDAPPWLPVEVNARLREFTGATAKRVFVFVDDFYLYPRARQPFVLEGMHACTRDADAWLKIASIKHLTRQWDSASQSGLEAPHDVDAIGLDLTLQDPEAATAFLLRLLESYAARAGIKSLQTVFRRRAIDRLVLASGAVPRDYLVLANQAIGEARKRANARVVGIEDVNRAAGQASAAKRRELEEDLAADSAEAGMTLNALSAIRAFCLERPGVEPYTYFRVSFRAKESRQEEYALLTRLLEVRMIHMLDASISDPKRAGTRFEVYMLDLSEYTGQRLRRGVHTLNFEGGRLTAQKTGEPQSRREGTRARDVTGIFRRAPELDLAVLTP